MPSFSEILPEQLMRLIGTSDCPTLIDLTLPEDRALDPFSIPTAISADYRDPEAIKSRIGPSKAVIICQKGKKLSHGVAAWLRSEGVVVEVLSGGNHAWRDKGLPRVPHALLEEVGRLWVTRHRPKIDRIACPWLIRRFIDPAARFLFVPPADVMDVAEKFDATPFDLEDVRWSHEGDLCTFDVLLKAFGLSHPALDRLAAVVRAADTNRHDLAPQAAGLLALSVGLSRQYKDDLAQLDAAMPLYDALYRWARDGYEEGHDWPTASPSQNATPKG